MSSQFAIIRALQSGGNGDLFLAQRSDTQEYVVVKYLREWHLAHARRAFAREVRVLRRGLRGLMPLLFADTAAMRPYYVMPYLTGGSLTRYAGSLNDSQLHAVAAGLADTLGNLHAGYSVHGDIKPDNVLVTQDGELQVADPLGNATVFTILFSENHGGTPGYWPPEIRAGGPISYAGDVYSYGATLYHLLIGRRPVDGHQLDPSLLGCTRAPEIRRIIAACCQIDPHARPTMKEVSCVLSGEQWADIRAARKQRQEVVTAACIVGGLALLWASLNA